jgi:hypothetical protein
MIIWMIFSQACPPAAARATNSLLNLTVERLMAVEGTVATAEMLRRLAELLRRGIRPEGDEGF